LFVDTTFFPSETKLKKYSYGVIMVKNSMKQVLLKNPKKEVDVFSDFASESSKGKYIFETL
jgi:hypothetical protein